MQNGDKFIGRAFVNFLTCGFANKAMRIAQSGVFEIGGRQIRVDWGKAKGSSNATKYNQEEAEKTEEIEKETLEDLPNQQEAGGEEQKIEEQPKEPESQQLQTKRTQYKKSKDNDEKKSKGSKHRSDSKKHKK